MRSKVKIQKAREFRKNPTASEKIMWDKLRRNNFLSLYFRRQYVIDGYIIDFYCHELKLAVEVDGSIHKKQIEDDEKKQKVLEEKGIRFFRISGREVEENVIEVLKKLKVFIENL